MKHDGGYSRTRRSDRLGNNPTPEPGADETDHRMLDLRNQEAQGLGTLGFPRGTTQTKRIASPTHSVLQDSRRAEGPR